MTAAETGKKPLITAGRLLLCCLLAAVCSLLLAIISLKIYVQTDHAAALLSEKLTAYLNQPVRIAGLGTAGGSIELSGVSIGNPAELPPGKIFSAESIGIAPHWGALLTGRRVLRSINLDGVRLDLLKSSAGVWNFSGLQRRFGGKKSAGKELLIEELTLKDGAFQLNGQGVQGISFRLFNLATKGSQNAAVTLAFEDGVKNSYTVTGTARPGPEPAFDLTLTAPGLSLKRLAGMLRLKNNPFTPESSGSLKLTASLQEGLLRAAGRLDFSRLAIPAPAGSAGSVTGALTYSLQTDELSVESIDMAVDRSMRLNASGTVAGLKSKRAFSGTVRVEELNLATLAFLLPEKERQKTSMAGSLGRSELRFAGTGSQGLSQAAGELLLADASLQRDGQVWFRGLNSRVTLTRVADGFLARGTLSQGETRAAVMESLQAPFTLVLSRRLKAVTAEIPSLKATVRGLTLNGRLGYKEANSVPITADLRIPEILFAKLPPLSAKTGLQLTSGSGSLDLKGSGKGVRDFTATVSARIAGLGGERSGTPFGLKNGRIDSRISNRSGRLDARGGAVFSGLALDKRHGDARFSYRFADGSVLLEDGNFSFDGNTVSIARLKGLLPQKESTGGTTRYPLVLDVAGGELRRGKLALKDFSGTARGSYHAAPRSRWLEGRADVAIRQLFWQGQPVADPAAEFVFSRKGGRGIISGALFEGGLSGEVNFDPLTPGGGGKFQLAVKGGHLEGLGKLFPQGGAILANGRADARFSGTFGGSAGFASRIGLEGSGITVTGKGGKTLIGGGGVDLAGSLSGARLVVDKGVLSAGKEVSLQTKGELAAPFSSRRQGQFTFSLPRTQLNSIIDQFVNILPRPIQEATTDGSLAAEGVLSLGDGRTLLEGALQPADLLLEMPSQKFRTAAVTGRIPFSLYLSGDSPAAAPAGNDFSRDNYPGLLQKLRSAPLNDQGLTIGSVEFGSLNLGELLLQLSSADGITRIDSLRGKLYEGALLGSGFVRVNKGVSYRADLLVNGLSLKKFCESIPKIKNYISGRLDGVISLKGGGQKRAGLLGFTELWAREGSGEKMLVSKDFLQKLSGKKLSGIFFTADRPFDRGEVAAVLEDGYLTFRKLDIVNTNLFGVRDLSVSIAPDQNRIAIDHLLNTVKEAAQRGKKAGGETAPAPPAEFKWEE